MVHQDYMITAVCLCVFSLGSWVRLSIQGPCFECIIYEEEQRKQLEKVHGFVSKDSHGCPRPCGCSTTEAIQCPDGVPVVMDGCDCCMMCSRQMGEPCSYRDVCDKSRHLSCHYASRSEATLRNATGMCRKSDGLTCTINGKTYKDGTHFKTDCRHSCLCLDGRVSCSDLCWDQETQKPPEAVCPGPVLFQPTGHCCKQWLCSKINGPTSQTAQSLPQIAGPTGALRTPCTAGERKTSLWSACSKSCGIGVSFRTSTDNMECRNITEVRICQWRPCSMDDYLLSEAECTATVKVVRSMQLTFVLNITSSSTSSRSSPYQQDPLDPLSERSGGQSRRAAEQVACHSVRPFRPKYCSRCLANHCCMPAKTKTKNLQFTCENGRTYFRKWEWIKKCICYPGNCP